MPADYNTPSFPSLPRPVRYREKAANTANAWREFNHRTTCKPEEYLNEAASAFGAESPLRLVCNNGEYTTPHQYSNVLPVHVIDISGMYHTLKNITGQTITDEIVHMGSTGDMAKDRITLSTMRLSLEAFS